MTTPISPQEGNPVGMRGIEFVEYLSRNPDKLGGVLSRLGFRLIARHRSRATFLYRQGTMNVIVNADESAIADWDPADESDQIHALAIRVDDANQAYHHCMRLGAWPTPTRADVMELNIPGFRCVGDSIIYLVDHRHDFSIYDVDFDYLTEARDVPPVVPDLRFFGLVQYINPGRTAEWTDFYAQILGFQPLPAGTRFGILPNGTILRSPDASFYLQLVEPMGDALFDVEWYEQFARLAFGTKDVLHAVDVFKDRSVRFEDNEFSRPNAHGAVTFGSLYNVSFELVHRDTDGADAGAAT